MGLAFLIGGCQLLIDIDRSQIPTEDAGDASAQDEDQDQEDDESAAEDMDESDASRAGAAGDE